MTKPEPPHETNIVVISPSASLPAALSQTLSSTQFTVVEVRPGPGVLGTVRREQPQIAVVDRIDERPEAAQLEIALLKELCPEARIIALSGESSDADAAVVEQGIFYYMAEPAVGDLVRVIQAAERAAAAKVEWTR